MKNSPTVTIGAEDLVLCHDFTAEAYFTGIPTGWNAGAIPDVSLVAPTNVAVVGSSGTLDITWTDAAGSTSTFIYLSTVSGSLVYHGFANVGTESYQITGLAAGTYYVALQSYDSVGDTYSLQTAEYSDDVTVGSGSGSPSLGETVSQTLSTATVGTRPVTEYAFTGGPSGHIENAALGADADFDNFNLGKSTYYGDSSADIEVASDPARGKVWHTDVANPATPSEYNGAIQYDANADIGINTKFKVSWWVKSTAAGGGQWKTFRLRNAANQFPETALFDWFGQGDLIDYSPADTDAGYSQWLASGQYADATDWVKYSLEIDTGTVGGGNGKFRLYAFESGGRRLIQSNNNTYGTFPDAMSIYTGSNRWNRLLWQNYSGNSLGQMDVYHDDLTVQIGSWASVEISDTAIYTDSTVTEEQRITAWTDNGDGTTTIVYELNRGGLVDGTYYEHIRDHDGAVVSSREITIGSSLLDSQDFESAAPWGNLVESHTGETRFARVTDDPQAGSYALRMNMNQSITDPLTGLVGNGLYTANFVPDLSGSSFEQQSWLARFKFDDHTWSSTNTGDSINAKLLYLLQSNTSDLASTFYVAGSDMGGATGKLNMADNGGDLANWHNESYGWGSAVSYGSSGAAWGTDGLWHKLQIDIDYINGGANNSRLRILIDDNPVTSSRTDANGWTQIPPRTGGTYNFDLRGLRLGYTGSGDVSGAADGTGYANGVQWDSFEVHEGLVEVGEP